MTTWTYKIAREAFFEVIETQLRNNTPTITRETYQRLTAAGHCHDEVMEMMARVLSIEVYSLSKNQSTFNQTRYSKNMRLLPGSPLR